MKTTEKYTYGYDSELRCWVVGEQTERGTIAKPLEQFEKAEAAKAAADALNTRHHENH